MNFCDIIAVEKGGYIMNRFNKIGLVTMASLSLLAACANNGEGNSNSANSAIQVTKGTTAETVSFFATGEYKEGVDIVAGDYYVVLTELEPGEKEGDGSSEPYVSFSVKRSEKNATSVYETIKESQIGKAYRVEVKEGDKIEFSEGYPANKSWAVTFFTSADYTNYRNGTSESMSSSSSSEEKAPSSSTTASSKKEEATATKPEKTTEGVVYTDSYIEVSKKGGLLSIKNLSGQDLILDGDVIFNYSKETTSNVGYIGDIKAGGTISENISSIDLIGEGEPGDTESGETLGSDKTFKHQMKKGEILTWNVKIRDKDYNTLAQITFEITY